MDMLGITPNELLSGESCVTISLSQMKATSFSASSNVTWNVKGKAQATLDSNFSKSYTIEHSSSRKVPSTHNGRKVKRTELKAYRLYDKLHHLRLFTSLCCLTTSLASSSVRYNLDSRTRVPEAPQFPLPSKIMVQNPPALRTTLAFLTKIEEATK